MDIEVGDIISKVHDRCGDTSHSKQESLDAYEEVQAACEASIEALRSELDAEEADLDEDDGED